MAKEKINKILIAGEGGQGVQVLAKILANIFVNQGFETTYIPQFGPEQRGTPSVAFLQYSRLMITFPKFDRADLILVLRKRAVKLIEGLIGPQTTIIFDSSTIPRRIINQKNSLVFGIPATKLATENYQPNVQNIIALAATASNILNINKNEIWQVTKKVLQSKFIKSPKLEKINKEAFDFGFHFNFENAKYSRPDYDVSRTLIIRKNKEKTAVIIPKFCKGCGICILKCPVKALSLGKTLGVYGTNTPEIDLEKCIACGNCFRFCPDCAIRVKKK